jgi:hypothetical protein
VQKRWQGIANAGPSGSCVGNRARPHSEGAIVDFGGDDVNNRDGEKYGRVCCHDGYYTTRWQVFGAFVESLRPSCSRLIFRAGSVRNRGVQCLRWSAVFYEEVKPVSYSEALLSWRIFEGARKSIEKMAGMLIRERQ